MIPKKICQTWKTKDLDPKMAKVVSELRKNNPEYDYVLFDDNECKVFLLEHFGQNYVNAFDALVPGAFKADLFRYCYLYVNGGIYLDIDMVPLVPLSQLVEDKDIFVSVVDRTVTGLVGIYQAFVACVPRHPILLYSLQIAFSNVATRRNGIMDTLSITGPGVMATAVNLFWNNKDTNKKIKPGVYEGVKLYRMGGQYTYDLEGKKIFNNKFEGYNPGGYYAWAKNFYKNDIRYTAKSIFIAVIFLILSLAIIFFLVTLFFKRKLKKCVESCSISSFI